MFHQVRWHKNIKFAQLPLAIDAQAGGDWTIARHTHSDIVYDPLQSEYAKKVYRQAHGAPVDVCNRSCMGGIHLW